MTPYFDWVGRNRVSVWAVFFLVNECWELDTLWLTEEKATRRAVEADVPNSAVEYRVERWWVT